MALDLQRHTIPAKIKAVKTKDPAQQCLNRSRGVRESVAWHLLGSAARFGKVLEPEWPTVAHFPRLATVVHRFKGHYYHWFAEELPRLLLLEEFFARLPEEQKEVLHGGAGSKAEQQLAVLVPVGAVEHFVAATLHRLQIKWKVRA